MKTLKEKRNIYCRNLLEDAFGDNINLVNDIFIEIKKQDKEFIKEILNEIKNLKRFGKANSHSIIKMIKQNSGFEK